MLWRATPDDGLCQDMDVDQMSACAPAGFDTRWSARLTAGRAVARGLALP